MLPRMPLIILRTLGEYLYSPYTVAHISPQRRLLFRTVATVAGYEYIFFLPISVTMARNENVYVITQYEEDGVQEK